jgi:hypothetical protein
LAEAKISQTQSVASSNAEAIRTRSLASSNSAESSTSISRQQTVQDENDGEHSVSLRPSTAYVSKEKKDEEEDSIRRPTIAHPSSQEEKCKTTAYNSVPTSVSKRWVKC